MYKEAAVLYQRLVEQFPQNKNLLGSYILALAYSDPIEAEKVIAKNALGKASTADAEVAHITCLSLARSHRFCLSKRH